MFDIILVNNDNDNLLLMFPYQVGVKIFIIYLLLIKCILIRFHKLNSYCYNNYNKKLIKDVFVLSLNINIVVFCYYGECFDLNGRCTLSLQYNDFQEIRIPTTSWILMNMC